MKFRHTLITILILLSAFSTQLVSAKTDSTAEIQQLLAFIGQSECVFIRNGSEHDAKNARKHIEKKYNYLKSRLNSAEDFIEHAASKSSFSGDVYTVRCDNKLITSEQWLTAALQDFRSSN